MATFFKLYALALPIFLVIDLVWLGVIARGFYRAQMGHLMRENVGWGAALAFYAIFVAGIVVLAVMPALEQESLRRAFWLGALLGLVAYAAYDLTNLATLEGFPLPMAVVDLCWGTLLCGSVSALTYRAWLWLA